MKMFRSDGQPRQVGSPRPRASQPGKSKAVLQMVEAMSIERIAALSGVKFSQDEATVSHCTELREIFIRWAVEEAPKNPKWSTEMDAWLDFRIAMKRLAA